MWRTSASGCGDVTSFKRDDPQVHSRFLRLAGSMATWAEPIAGSMSKGTVLLGQSLLSPSENGMYRAQSLKQGRLSGPMPCPGFSGQRRPHAASSPWAMLTKIAQRLRLNVGMSTEDDIPLRDRQSVHIHVGLRSYSLPMSCAKAPYRDLVPAVWTAVCRARLKALSATKSRSIRMTGHSSHGVELLCLTVQIIVEVTYSVWREADRLSY